MIPKSKLNDNYHQSQQWADSFRSQIKQLMHQMTTKNQDITRISRKNIDLHAKIDKAKSELKQVAEDKNKVRYKIDKMDIKIEEREKRLQLYSEIFAKKQEWNKELNNKVINLELDIENQRQNLRELQKDQVCQEKELDLEVCSATERSGTSRTNLSFKQNSLKKVFGNPRSQINERLTKIKKMEGDYQREKKKLRLLEGQFQIAVKKGQKYKEEQRRLGGLMKEENKENTAANYQQKHPLVEQQVKQTRETSTKLREMEEESVNLSNKISQSYKRIEEYSNLLKQIMQEDNEAATYHKEVVDLEREVKREKAMTHSFKSYILSENNS